MNFNTLASKEVQTKTAEALHAKGYEVYEVKTGNDALEKIKTLIPKGASIMNGSSRTLEQIGFVEFLKSGKHEWNNLHDAIIAEKNPDKQTELRKQSVLSDYYLGSVHALTQEGEFIIVSASESQLPHIIFTSPNLIFVVGAQKIVPTLYDARNRVKEYVFPLEDERMKEAGYAGSMIAKELIFHGELAVMGRKINFILVNEALGF
ncbi:lactate utilization protein [Candidatus Uhrbacteria bacterium]|nr:lactate utilization protein [Candidatus Uhrbacteria bacterium]